MDLVKAVEASYMRDQQDHVDIGDHVRVHLMIKEGERKRIQVYGFVSGKMANEKR